MDEFWQIIELTRKRVTQELIANYTKIKKASVYYTILNQPLPSREAKVIIQNIIQDLSFNVEPSIRKGSSAYRAPRSTEDGAKRDFHFLFGTSGDPP